MHRLNWVSKNLVSKNRHPETVSSKPDQSDLIPVLSDATKTILDILNHFHPLTKDEGEIKNLVLFTILLFRDLIGLTVPNNPKDDIRDLTGKHTHIERKTTCI